MMTTQKKSVIPVAFASDNAFIPIFAVCLQSIMDQSSEQYDYDILLLHSDITEENKNTLLKMISEKPNFSLRFYNAAPLVKNYRLDPCYGLPIETYYRFLIQKILPEYDKVLYLDCDLIVLADVAELYQTDIDGYSLAAVKDAGFLGQINYSETLKNYIKTDLPMQNPHNYFNAGVLLLNTEELRKAYSIEEWLTFASKKYLFNDQDVLNLYCEGRVKYLPMTWNLMNDNDNSRISNDIVHAADIIQKEYFAARSNPKIIHYAGRVKPWQCPSEDLASYFWKVAAKTPYFELLLQQMVEYTTTEAIKNVSFKTKLIRKLKPAVNLFFPLQTKRRETLKKLLGK